MSEYGPEEDQDRDDDFGFGQAEYESVPDSRNHLTLVDKLKLKFITRLTTKQAFAFARYKALDEYYRRRREGNPMRLGELNAYWVDQVAQYLVSVKGLGRTELVDAMKADHALMDLMDAETVPGREEREKRRKGGLLRGFKD